jgi:hypothetical protein
MPNMPNAERANTTVRPAPPLPSLPRKRRPMNTLLSSPGARRVEGENEKTVIRSIRQPTTQSEILNSSLNCPPRNAARPAAAAKPTTKTSITLRPVETSDRVMPGLWHRRNTLGDIPEHSRTRAACLERARKLVRCETWVKHGST